MRIKATLIFFIFVSPFVIADGNNQHFHHDTYDHALSSEFLGKAAKCEVLSNMLNYPKSTKYFTKTASKVSFSNGEIYPSNKFLEIKLAYNTVKNFHYGRFSVFEELDPANAKSKFTDFYNDLECNEIIEQ